MSFFRSPTAAMPNNTQLTSADLHSTKLRTKRRRSLSPESNGFHEKKPNSSHNSNQEALPTSINQMHLRTHNKISQYISMNQTELKQAIKEINSALENAPDDYYSKTDSIFAKTNSPTKYSALKHNGKNYLVFPGKKQNLHLAEGCHGTLKYGYDITQNKVVVIKVLDPAEDTSGKLKKNSANEASIMHIQNRLSAFPADVQPDKHHPLFLTKHKNVPSDKQKMILVMDLEEGIDGYNFCMNYSKTTATKIPLITTLTIITNMLKEVKRLLNAKILHRDIKLENFIINEQSLEVKIIDFGCAIKTQNNIHKSRAILGTKNYLPPEIAKPTKPINVYSEQTEVFSLGTTFYHLADRTSTHPFDEPFRKEIFKVVQSMRWRNPDHRISIATAIDSIQKISESYIFASSFLAKQTTTIDPTEPPLPTPRLQSPVQ
jgi:serine/threonine protein kinase